MQTTAPVTMSKDENPAERYYEWSWKRYQQRVLRLTMALVVLMAIAITVVVLMGLRIRDLEANFADESARVSSLESRIDDLGDRESIRPSNVTTQQDLQRQRCLDNAIQRLNEGLRRVMALDIPPRQFLARYRIPRCL
ncbi:MAG: hypothetical protein M3238_05040 [Actinomycetota bacterium]|nr:hypothetical protein [Actinomycetota bacterium]